MTAELFSYLIYGWIVLAVIVFPIQLFVTAPYGRHQRSGWWPVIDNRFGWIVMEIVSPVIFAIFFLSGPSEKTTALWIIFCLWMTHYVHRSVIFPMRMQTSGKVIPVMIVVMAASFNAANGWANGWYLGSGFGSYPISWLTDPRFILGLAIFFVGAYINITSDNSLLGLRRDGETGYRIPQGRVFNLVSCPNHLGEIIQWTGFAILCWNLPALAFSIWTAANLIPRAIAHHKWYRNTFPNFPADRKALIPYLL